MPEDMRARTRRAVRAELAATAQALFAERGFAETTIDEVAAAAGMSRRTLHRYFASKEALVVGKYDLWLDETVAALRRRPADEAPWTALRRTFDLIVAYYADPVRRAQVTTLQHVIDASPSLRGATLEVFDRLQRGLAEVLVERLVEPSLARVLVGSAWTCVQAALRAAIPDDPDSLPGRIDALMDQIGPSRGG